jgi:carbon starvation protein
MNVAALLFPALILYVLAQRFYVPRLARAFGEDDSRATPAVTQNDGVDYVPTRPHVLFAHHFSAIAAAGPILGPTMALLFGYAPAILWIVVGAILIGAVHDFACLFVSMREGGRSIAEIARRTLGDTAFVLFALFIVFNLVVVNAVFIHLTAVSLTSLRTPQELGLAADQTIFRTVADANGTTKAVVGGIASSSAIFLTVIAPVLGFLMIRRRMRERYSYPLATVLCVGSVLLGFAYPVHLPSLQIGSLHVSPTDLWVLLIALYVWFAAAVPVWLILQPREFVSVQFLYLGILLLVAAVIGAGLQGQTVCAPAADLELGEHSLGSLWPTLFVTIACGAVSGFHGLVASGTTSKQIARESHARNVGYLAMLGESGLALCVTLAIAAGISFTEYESFQIRPADSPDGWKANPVLAFSVGVAGICHIGLGIPPWLGVVFGLLMVEGFVLDTLDVAIRLNRYLLEEIRATVFGGRLMHFPGSYWVDSGISVVLMLSLAIGNTADRLWPIFGTGNQLLAALSLLTISVWMVRRRRPAVYVLIPAILVGVTTLASLVYLLFWKYWPQERYLLAGTALVFLLLALGYIGLVIRGGLRDRRGLKAC